MKFFSYDGFPYQFDLELKLHRTVEFHSFHIIGGVEREERKRRRELDLNAECNSVSSWVQAGEEFCQAQVAI